MTKELNENIAHSKLNPVSPMEVPIMFVVVLLSSVVAVSFAYIGKTLNHDIHSANYVMIFLTGVLFVSCRSSRKTALICSLLSVLAYDFFFVTPYYSFVPSDKQYFVVVLFMFVVALVVNELAYRARNFAQKAYVLEQEAETEKLKNTLLRSVSHDLKSPLTSIMGAATLLGEETKQPLSDKQKRELANSIAFESSRLNRIVSNLLDMTRLESGGISLNKDWYHFDELLANAISSIETRFGQQSIDIYIEEDLPLLKVDPLLIEQLLTNLIDNCVKYAPDKTYKIKALVNGNSDSLEVSIHNEGSQIEPEESNQLFEKFYRGQLSESGIPGAGLGLSICQSIVTLHDGRIWFDPDEKKGATIVFRIPLPEDAPVVELETEDMKS